MKAKERIKAIGHITANRPHVVVVPLVLTGLMMGLGVWAVMRGASDYTTSARTKAAAHVEAAASALQLSIQQALLPAKQLADWVMHTRDYATIQAQWNDHVPGWWDEAPRATYYMVLAPQGLVSNVHPNPELNKDLLVIDILNDTAYRPLAMETIRSRGVTVQGPQYNRLRNRSSMIFQVPVFIKDVSEGETWGIPHNVTDCPVGLCYNATTRTKWWGSAILTLNSTAFTSSDGPLANLLEAGYQMQLWRPDKRVAAETQWVVVDVNGARPQPADAIKAVVPVADVKWEVYVWSDSWEASWKEPLIATVVVVSVICGCLIFAVLLSWEEQCLLLHSILPKAAINRMRSQMDWRRGTTVIDGPKLMEIETPAQQMLSMIQSFLKGEAPPMATVVAVQQALQRSADVYTPANRDLKLRIRHAGNMDIEVQQALVRQLAGNTTVGHRKSSAAENRDSTDLGHGDLHEMLRLETMPEDSEQDSEGWSPACQPSGPDSDPGIAAPRLPTSPDSSRPLTVFSPLPTSTLPTSPDSSRLPKVYNPFDDRGLSTDAVWLAMVIRPDTSQEANIPADEDLVPALGTKHIMRAMNTMAGPEKPMKDQLEVVLSGANTWRFDVFKLEEVSQGRPLSVLAYWLMVKSGCMESARMDGAVLARFLQRVEEGYPQNPYHNSRHAAGVLQMLHMILHGGGMAPRYCDTREVLACYLAAIVHDYEHRGCTNDFLINTTDELAVRYNDRSPMENHHVAAAWSLLLQPGLNCLSGLSKSTLNKLRKLIIELVLATDMRQHFAIMGQFNTSRTTDVGTSSELSMDVDRTSAARSGRLMPPLSEQDKLLGLQVALKCADLGHLAAPLPLHQRWVAALEEEFFMQGDKERARGMEISPLCDRNKEGVTKSQVGFFDFVVLPTFTNFSKRFQLSSPMREAVLTNYRYWQYKATQASQE